MSFGCRSNTPSKTRAASNKATPPEGQWPIPDDEVLFNILAPGVVEQHLTFGFTRSIDADSSFAFAAMYAPAVEVSGANTFDPAQEIDLEMDQYEFTFSYNRRL